MLRPVGIMVANGTRSVFPYVSRSGHFWTNMPLVPHGLAPGRGPVFAYP